MPLACVHDYQRLARARLARIASDYLEGGAEELTTLRRNRAAYDELRFTSRVLRDVATTDTATTVLCRAMRLPALVGPTGLNGLYYPRAEEALARQAHQAGLVFVLSTASTSLLEDVRAASDGPLWLQLYVQRDHSIARDLLARARRAGYEALMLTVDTPVHGSRDYAVRNGFRLPLRWTPRLIADLLTHPRWCLRMLRQGGAPRLVNIARSLGAPAADLAGQAAVLSRQMDMQLDWDFIHWLRDQWPGPILLKGLMSVADAQLAQTAGYDGIVLSNHGGRQLDGLPSPLDVLPAVRAAVGAQMTVLIDGGIRRGSDIAKAVALGANATLMGRAPLYGLAACGEAGVAEVLAILQREYETCLKLLGCPTTAALDGGYLHR